MPQPRLTQSARSFVGHLVLIGVLTILVLWPVAMVLSAAWQGRGESEPGLTAIQARASLAFQTFLLVIWTLVIALPLGIATALAVFRCDVPGRRWWAMVILLPALVPTDLHATAWLAALGPQGLAKSIGLPIELKGVLAAAWIHAMASVPWVVALVGAAVSVVEAELEEDCLLLAGPIRTVWHVTLRRSSGAIVAAALLIAVLTAGDMAVTDLLQVRTYAETVYTEFAVAGRVGAATATAVPGLAVWIALVAVAGTLVVRQVPQDSQAFFASRPTFRLGPWRWLGVAGCCLIVLATLGIPTGSLVWRAGMHYPKRPPGTADLRTRRETSPEIDEDGPRHRACPGGLTAFALRATALESRLPIFSLSPQARRGRSVDTIRATALESRLPIFSLSPQAGRGRSAKTNAYQGEDASRPAAGPRWSLRDFTANLIGSARAAGPQLAFSLKLAAATAAVTVPLAWVLAICARASVLGRAVAAVVACLLFALPGPVLGIGIVLALGRPTAWWGGAPLSLGGQVAALLARVADSPAALVWLHSLRALPFAMGLLWPVVRLVNRSLLEAAQIDGAGPWRRFWHVELPACRTAALSAALVCAVLSIGELAGSVIVTPPGRQPLSVRIFTLAHFGVENHLAGICLVLLGVAVAGSLAVLFSLRWTVRSLGE